MSGFREIHSYAYRPRVDNLFVCILPRCKRSMLWSSADTGFPIGVGISAAGKRMVLFTKSSIEPATALSNGFLTIGRDVSLWKLCADIFDDAEFCYYTLLTQHNISALFPPSNRHKCFFFRLCYALLSLVYNLESFPGCKSSRHLHKSITLKYRRSDRKNARSYFDR